VQLGAYDIFLLLSAQFFVWHAVYVLNSFVSANMHAQCYTFFVQPPQQLHIYFLLISRLSNCTSHAYPEPFLLKPQLFRVKGSMPRSLAVHLTPDQLKPCFEELPLLSMRNNKFIEYDRLNMKHAPCWEKMNPYTRCLDALLRASGGKQNKHLSMMAGAQAFAEQQQLKLVQSKIEQGAYSLRVMISQLRNMKRKSRNCPRRWQSAFATLVDRISDDEEDDHQDDPVQLVSVHIHDPNEVEFVSSSQPSADVDL